LIGSGGGGTFAKGRELLQKRGLFCKREGSFSKGRALLQKRGQFCKREGDFAKGRALLQKRGHFCKREGDFAKERAILQKSPTKIGRIFKRDWAIMMCGSTSLVDVINSFIFAD